MEKQRHSFKGTIGFVLAAAGSAVGLGNIWRFPYLAAQAGGGMFIVIYLILTVTFGFTLLITEIAIGRKTKQSPLTAYRVVNKKAGWMGTVACVIPAIIVPYYCVIGGWVIHYFFEFASSNGPQAAADGYFNTFISAELAPIWMAVIFLVIVTFIVIRGVNKGIENFSKVLMPILILLVVAIAFFSLTIRHTDDDGTVRTGLQGLAVYLIPDFEGMTVGKFLSVLISAAGQLFYSLSIAMGIMVAYGSYLSDDTNLSKAVGQIELFDTGVAILAGVMIIPAIYAFGGREAMSANGPGLMFIALPKVFAEMGRLGGLIGCLFFLMVLFAAVTSAVSLMEAVVSSFMDRFGLSRLKASLLEFAISLAGAVIVCLGYNKLYFEVTLPTGAVGQILDILDYFSNYILMPIIAIATCILIGWVTKPSYIIEEAEKNGCKMGRKRLYVVMIKYVVPVILFILFLKSSGILNI